MQRVMLKSKIHRASVTDCDLHYVGSVTVDPDLLEPADILEFEQVAVVDIANGARFETYTIAGDRGSREVKINGAAARLVHRGDTIIVISYAAYDSQELTSYVPRVVHVTPGNEILNIDNEVATLLASTDGASAGSTAEMLMLASAVRRGLETPLLVGDLPFGSYEASDEQAVGTAQRFVKEAGCDAVKLERGGTSAERARAIVQSGIPVMGHVGLTPQTATALGGYRAQGRTSDRALSVAEDALALQDAGCFSIVFEAIPAAVSVELMERLE